VLVLLVVAVVVGVVGGGALDEILCVGLVEAEARRVLCAIGRR